MGDEICSEPSDIAMTIIDLVSKCCGEDNYVMKWAAKLLRVMLSTALNIAICTNFVIRYIPVLNTVAFILPMFLVELICLFVVGMLLRGVMVGSVKQRTFIIVYKSLDFIFSGVNAGFMIYEREKINFSNWEEVAAVALTGLDILNPIEAVIACCWSK